MGRYEEVFHKSIDDPLILDEIGTALKEIGYAVKSQG